MFDHEQQIAISAAQKAGDFLRQSFKKTPMEVRRKGDDSPVTDHDLKSHEMIVHVLRSAFPNHAILSEEQPDADTRIVDQSPTWIIDPLDGTSNFIAGIPLFGITIALVVEYEPVLGIIYDPIHHDLFVAQKGKGTWLNNERAHVSKNSSTQRAMFFAGRGYKERVRKRHGQIIYTLERETTYFRRLGAASIMLSSVAVGRADSVILTGNQSWDLVAGSLLVLEAGGKVTEYCGKPWHIGSEDMLATNGHVHDQLIAMINKGAPDICQVKAV